MKINTALAVLSLPLAIVSCKKDVKKTENTTSISNDSIKTVKVEDKIDYTNFNIYNVTMMQRNELTDTFISVSDVYKDPHPVQEDILKNKRNFLLTS